MTPRGRLYNVLGYVFSVYCIYKVSMATRSILKQGTLVAAAGAATIIPAPPGGAAAAAAGGGSKPVPDRATLSARSLFPLAPSIAPNELAAAAAACWSLLRPSRSTHDQPRNRGRAGLHSGMQLANVRFFS